MNKELTNKINTMAEVDQDARFNANNKFIVYSIDSVHETKLKEIVKENGYPTKEMIGEEGMEKLWLLVQHVEFNTALQEGFLNNCDFNPREHMFLYDRIKINQGLDQKFGTQFVKIIDLEKSNNERVKGGWVTVEDYIEKHNSEDDRKIELKKNDDGSAEYIV